MQLASGIDAAQAAKAAFLLQNYVVLRSTQQHTLRAEVWSGVSHSASTALSLASVLSSSSPPPPSSSAPSLPSPSSSSSSSNTASLGCGLRCGSHVNYRHPYCRQLQHHDIHHQPRYHNRHLLDRRHHHYITTMLLIMTINMLFFFFLLSWHGCNRHRHSDNALTGMDILLVPQDDPAAAVMLTVQYTCMSS